MVAHTVTEARLASPNNQPFVEFEDGRSLAEAISGYSLPCSKAQECRPGNNIITTNINAAIATE